MGGRDRRRHLGWSSRDGRADSAKARAVDRRKSLACDASCSRRAPRRTACNRSAQCRPPAPERPRPSFAQVPRRTSTAPATSTCSAPIHGTFPPSASSPWASTRAPWGCVCAVHDEFHARTTLFDFGPKHGRRHPLLLSRGRRRSRRTAPPRERRRSHCPRASGSPRLRVR